MNNNHDNLSEADGGDQPAVYIRADDHLLTGTHRRKFGARTIMIPILFILLHLVVVNLTAVAFILADLLSGSLKSGLLADPNLLMNTEYLNEIIVRYTPQIAFVYSLILIPSYFICLRQLSRKNPDAVWLRKATATEFLPALAIITGAMGVTSLYFLFLDWLSGRSALIEKLMSDYLELSGSLTADTNYIWLAIGIGIAAPVAEELLFRGIVQGEFRRVMPEWAAVVIQAVLFSAFHMQIVQSSYVLLPGLLLGIAYAWSKSLWIPIAMHILFNLLGSLLPALVQANEGLSSAVVLVEIIFIPIAVVAAVYLHRKTRRAAGRIADRTADRTAE